MLSPRASVLSAEALHPHSVSAAYALVQFAFCHVLIFCFNSKSAHSFKEEEGP